MKEMWKNSGTWRCYRAVAVPDACARGSPILPDPVPSLSLLLRCPAQPSGGRDPLTALHPLSHVAASGSWLIRPLQGIYKSIAFLAVQEADKQHSDKK